MSIDREAITNGHGGSRFFGRRDAVEQLLTPPELAERLHLHVKTVERMARAGRLPSLRVCGRVRFRPSDIASWLAEREDRTCHGS